MIKSVEYLGLSCCHLAISKFTDFKSVFSSDMLRHLVSERCFSGITGHTSNTFFRAKLNDTLKIHSIDFHYMKPYMMLRSICNRIRKKSKIPYQRVDSDGK